MDLRVLSAKIANYDLTSFRLANLREPVKNSKDPHERLLAKWAAAQKYPPTWIRDLSKIKEDEV
jgi:hypothetical protein